MGWAGSKAAAIFSLAHSGYGLVAKFRAQNVAAFFLYLPGSAHVLPGSSHATMNKLSYEAFGYIALVLQENGKTNGAISVMQSYHGIVSSAVNNNMHIRRGIGQPRPIKYSKVVSLQSPILKHNPSSFTGPRNPKKYIYIYIYIKTSYVYHCVIFHVHVSFFP